VPAELESVFFVTPTRLEVSATDAERKAARSLSTGGKGDQTDQESRSSAAAPVPSIRPVQMGRFTHWRNCHE
jgi:hypothetical protein